MDTLVSDTSVGNGPVMFLVVSTATVFRARTMRCSNSVTYEVAGSNPTTLAFAQQARHCPPPDMCSMHVRGHLHVKPTLLVPTAGEARPPSRRAALHHAADVSPCQRWNSLPSLSAQAANQPCVGTGVLSAAVPPSSRTLAHEASMSSVAK